MVFPFLKGPHCLSQHQVPKTLDLLPSAGLRGANCVSSPYCWGPTPLRNQSDHHSWASPVVQPARACSKPPGLPKRFLSRQGLSQTSRSPRAQVHRKVWSSRRTAQGLLRPHLGYLRAHPAGSCTTYRGSVPSPAANSGPCRWQMDRTYLSVQFEERFLPEDGSRVLGHWVELSCGHRAGLCYPQG